MATDTAAVRRGEELNKVALGSYLASQLPSVQGPLEIEQFPGGHSNLTYLVRAGISEYVLRRAPLGPVAPKAHDMAREFRVLQAISPLFPPAPRPYLLCEDPSVLGAVFYLMERRKGLILRTGIPAEIQGLKQYQQRLSDAFLDCFAALHAIDIEANGLTELGKPEGFVERQVKGWADRWRRAATDDSPEMDRVIAWLNDNIPPSGRPTLVHNDYKLDNVMFPENSIDRVEAVLDWEMTTVGDPMIDVGLTLCYWCVASSPEISGNGVPGFTAEPGWYSREQFLETYVRKTGRELVAIRFHEILGVFKLAVILQQIYSRYRKGQTLDERFANFGTRVAALTRKAVEILDAS